MASPDAVLAPVYRSTDLFVSENAFKIVLWTGTGVCTVVCALRFAARILTFRRLFTEDYLMLLSLLALVALAAVLQHFLADIYFVLMVQNHAAILGPDFPTRLVSGMRGDGVALILNTVGIWAIKLNFMAFFRRFGAQVRAYMVAWWVACFLVVACGAVQIGLIPYRCVFGSFSHLTTTCATQGSIEGIYASYKATVAVDVVSDAIIICFPSFIAWRTRISLRQKILLTGIFLLVGFTVAVTIVRGSIFGGVYKSINEVDGKVINMVWLLFWYMIQYLVSFIIACVISFRSLWVKKRDTSSKNQEKFKKGQRAIGDSSPMAGRQHRSPWARLHDSLLQTLADLEARDIEQDPKQLLKHQPPSANLTVDFSDWGRGDNDLSTTDTYKGSSPHPGTLNSSQSRDD